MFGHAIAVESVGSLWMTTLNYFENTGSPTSPTFGSSVPIMDDNTGKQLRTSGSATYPSAFDFDRDGDTDLVIGHLGLLEYYENIGDNQFVLKETIMDEEDFPIIQCTFGDLNNDGLLDMVYLYA